MRRSVVLAVVLIAVALGAGVGNAQAADDLEAVRQANADFLQAASARDIDATATFWRQHDDVRAIHPFRPIDRAGTRCGRASSSCSSCFRR